MYGLKNNLEKIFFIGSFRMHNDSIHKIFVMDSLSFVVTSSFDSSMKVWRPPQEWERKIFVSNSMIEGSNPQENLSMIREEHNESADPESQYIKHRITTWGDPGHDNVVESLLSQI